MSRNLKQAIRTNLKGSLRGAGKLAVLGIGSDLRGDDGAGALIAEELLKSLSKLDKKLPARVFSGGTAPENLTGEIRRYKPSHVIIIDAADFHERPGTVVLLDPEDVGSGVSFSTHKMPAKILADYLRKSLMCELIIIGIQPKSVEFGKPLSKIVASTVKDVAGAIKDIILNR